MADLEDVDQASCFLFQNVWARQYPSKFSANKVSDCQKRIGKKMTDCTIPLQTLFHETSLRPRNQEDPNSKEEKHCVYTGMRPCLTGLQMAKVQRQKFRSQKASAAQQRTRHTVVAGTPEQLSYWHCCLLGSLGLTQAKGNCCSQGSSLGRLTATTQHGQKALSIPEGIQHLLPAGVTGGDPVQGCWQVLHTIVNKEHFSDSGYWGTSGMGRLKMRMESGSSIRHTLQGEKL